MIEISKVDTVPSVLYCGSHASAPIEITWTLDHIHTRFSGVERRARPLPLRVSRVTLSGAPGTARVGGIGSGGDEGEESADGNVAPFLHRMQGIRRDVSSRSGRRSLTLRGQSLALGGQSGDPESAHPPRSADVGNRLENDPDLLHDRGRR